jgi:hypothetical protein
LPTAFFVKLFFMAMIISLGAASVAKAPDGRMVTPAPVLNSYL